MNRKKINNYLEKEMCICLCELNKEIKKFICNEDLIYKYLELLINFNLTHKEFELGSYEFYDNQDSFNFTVNDFLEKNKISSDKDNYYIFDTLRHAFLAYKTGGIIKLYESQQNEEGYPKIKISKFLGKDGDIDLLPSTITIYRGTSIKEYQEGVFSQPWSLKLDIAKAFAFNHYRGQPMYLGTERVVLKTDISKKSIYYYDKNNNENEVIVKSCDIHKENVLVVDEGIQE